MVRSFLDYYIVIYYIILSYYIIILDYYINTDSSVQA